MDGHDCLLDMHAQANKTVCLRANP